MEEPAGVTEWMKQRLRIANGTVVLELGAPWIRGPVLAATVAASIAVGIAGALGLQAFFGEQGLLAGLVLATVGIWASIAGTLRLIPSHRLVFAEEGLAIRTGLLGRVSVEAWEGLEAHAHGTVLRIEGITSHGLSLASAPPDAGQTIALILSHHAREPAPALHGLIRSIESGELARPIRHGSPPPSSPNSEPPSAETPSVWSPPRSTGFGSRSGLPATRDGVRLALSPVQRPVPLPFLGTIGVFAVGLAAFAPVRALDLSLPVIQRASPALAAAVALLGLAMVGVREARGQRPVHIEMTIDPTRMRVLRTHTLGRQTHWSAAISSIERVELVGKTLRVHTTTGSHDLSLPGRSKATLEALYRRIAERLERVQDAGRTGDVPGALAQLVQPSTER